MTKRDHDEPRRAIELGPPRRPGEGAGEPNRGSRPSAIWLVVLVVAGVVGFFLTGREEDERAGGGGAGVLADAGPAAAEAAAVRRCTRVGGEAFEVGEPNPEPEEAPDGGEREPVMLTPFAVEVGRGAPSAQGFAVGIKYERESEGERGFHVAVVELGAEGKGRIVDLGRSRGDMDAPLVVAAQGGWVAAMLEPDAGGLSLRLVRSKAGELHWGAELVQGRDESLAHDLALGETIAAVTWDDVVDDGERAVVMLATVTADGLEGGEKAKAVSRKPVDAELPRVIARPGGFWLAYIARDRIGEDDAKREPEGRYRAERIAPSWIELVPLDAQGALQGAPTPVTSRDGHVLAFDIAIGKDGAAHIAWRDDDTPSGAQGGSVSTIVVTQGGAGQVQPVAEEMIGGGVPDLVGGWLALPQRDGRLQLAPVGDDGTLTGVPILEPALGAGRVVAGAEGKLLVAQPDGRAARLFSVRCDPNRVPFGSEPDAGAL